MTMDAQQAGIHRQLIAQTTTYTNKTRLQFQTTTCADVFADWRVLPTQQLYTVSAITQAYRGAAPSGEQCAKHGDNLYLHGATFMD